MVVRAGDVEAVEVRGDDAGDEQEAVDQRVGVGPREEEDGEGREEEVDEGEDEAGEHCFLSEAPPGRVEGFTWLRGDWR